MARERLRINQGPQGQPIGVDIYERSDLPRETAEPESGPFFWDRIPELWERQRAVPLEDGAGHARIAEAWLREVGAVEDAPLPP